MDCMRINCAHDNEAAWVLMVEHLRRAESTLQRRCHLLMDLAGPKLRTGPVGPSLAVTKVRPRRDALGRVLLPARVWLTPQERPRPAPDQADADLSVPGAWLAVLKAGQKIHFSDARDSRRTLDVVQTGAEGCLAELHKTAYFVPGLELVRHGHRAALADFPPREGALFLQQGDALILTRDGLPGQLATTDEQGAVLTPARIGCLPPEAFRSVRVGERVLFDDGHISAVIERVNAEGIGLRITRTRPGGGKLGGGKGINLPDSRRLPAAMTSKDIQDLRFVARNADMVALSFANSAADVRQLMKEIVRQGEERPAIVLKIETRKGFDNLPEMLLEAMKWPCCGVMIARGDLAVECGFERLAEVQEEILWICESAHVPVIWATQVLETLAREGQPSRAEITDAAMGDRAECVMLNKGPHILEAVRTLDDILRRMQAHQSKKSPRLRALRLARRFTDETAAGRIDASDGWCARASLHHGPEGAFRAIPET
jgi:pyruvate kinase